MTTTTISRIEGRARKARGSARFTRPSITVPPPRRASFGVDIPDRACDHGGRLRTCPWPTCVEARYGAGHRARKL